VKKKYTASPKDKKEWLDFIKNIDDINPKEADFTQPSQKKNKTKKIDLHGFSLDEANKIVKNFIIKCYNAGFQKLLIITGKGSKTKFSDNPYVSKNLHVLRYSVPEFIKNDENLNNKIIEISEAPPECGGEGALYVFLKKNKNL